MKCKFCIALLLMVVAAGCAAGDKKPRKSQGEVAKEQWNATRAAVLMTLAKDQYELGQFDKSRKTVDEALKLHPVSASIRVLSAKLHIEAGELEQAQAELALARAYDANNAQVDYLAGVIEQRWQKPEKAAELYASAMAKDPKELAYILARAEMLVLLEKTPDAIAELQRALPRFENSAVLCDTLGQLLMAQGQWEQAVAVLRQATVLATEDQSIREHLARAYFYNGNWVQASDLYARLLKDPAHKERHDLFLALAECQMQTGRFADARGNLETACKLQPSSAQAWMSLGKASLQLKDLRRAEIAIQKSIALDQTSSEAYLLLGYLRTRQERHNEALAAFQKSSLLDRSDSLSLCMIGYVLQRTGKPEQALQFYARALQLKPNDELAEKLMASVDLQ